MTDLNQSDLTSREINSVDDDPIAAKLVRLQEIVNKWLKPTAMLPFILLLIVDFKFFPTTNNWLLVSLGLATVLWATGVNMYSFYLRMAFRCPRCGDRFGSSENCIHCSLPRHAPSIKSQYV